jgi:TRAP transporter 4TM/12TM fusion protein
MAGKNDDFIPVDTKPTADLETLVAEADLGGRKPIGPARWLLIVVPLLWSLFQVWYASPFPYQLNIGVFNDTQARSIHLAFAIFLAFMSYPAFRRSSRQHIPWADVAFALVGALCALYLYLFREGLAERPGLPTTLDLVASVIGVLLLVEAARRCVGPALAIIVLLMLAYIFAGPYLPELVSHKGATLGRVASQMWLSTEGVFGVAIGVSTSVVFMFVLFGTLLEKAGAGNYFIQLAFSLVGHMRGGPAKAGVIASGLTGMISGSSIANVVTTGTFTIPLMKRVGYSAVKAGAIESAAGINGQIMPPVMGAAAFLIAEYVGISYAQVVKHAFIPAIVTYLALFYIVHLEAVKSGMQGLPRNAGRTRWLSAVLGLMVTSGFVALCGLIYFAVSLINQLLPAISLWIIGALTLAAYVALIWYKARYPDLPADSADAILRLPDFFTTARTGLHYLIPVVILVWCLMVESLSPSLSAFWAAAFLVLILLTQRSLLALFRNQPLQGVWRHGIADLRDGLVGAGRNMTTVGIATAAAGVVVGTVTLTGIGLVMTEIVTFVSGGNLLVMLIMTALVCLVLGMGMPTTAAYVVVATLMAPVLVQVASENELGVALVTVHLFVFYFGLMADVTPPVGLAGYAAAAISGADPVKTGAQAFLYEMRTALLPFIFIFNQEVILLDVHSPLHFLLVFGACLLAMMLFVAASQGIFVSRNRWYEALVLLAVAFVLVRPGYFLDQYMPPFERVSAAGLPAEAGRAGDDGALRLRVISEKRDGSTVDKLISLPLGKPGSGDQRLRNAGLSIMEGEGGYDVMAARFGTAAHKLGLKQGDRIVAIELPQQRPSKYWISLLALLPLGLVVALQLRRRRRGETLVAVPFKANAPLTQ